MLPGGRETSNRSDVHPFRLFHCTLKEEAVKKIMRAYYTTGFGKKCEEKRTESRRVVLFTAEISTPLSMLLRALFRYLGYMSTKITKNLFKE